MADLSKLSSPQTVYDSRKLNLSEVGKLPVKVLESTKSVAGFPTRSIMQEVQPPLRPHVAHTI